MLYSNPVIVLEFDEIFIYNMPSQLIDCACIGLTPNLCWWAGGVPKPTTRRGAVFECDIGDEGEKSRSVYAAIGGSASFLHQSSSQTGAVACGYALIRKCSLTRLFLPPVVKIHPFKLMETQ